MPIHRRLPKRGFTNIFKKDVAIINIEDIAHLPPNSVVDEEMILSINSRAYSIKKSKINDIKILGKGDINIPLHVKIRNISRGAKAKIEAAGGMVESVSESREVR